MSTEIFNAVAPRYDMTNAVLSWGMDTGWRNRMLCHLPQGEGQQVLDLATGTGDVAMILAADPRVHHVIGIDPAEKMLEVARAKVQKAGMAHKIKLSAGDALNLDFKDEYFHAVTAAFGLRNFPDLMKGLMEAYRVIRPGGRMIVLEFSVPSNRLSMYLHRLYLKVFVPLIGMFLTGKFQAYHYLSSTALAFPSGERFARIMAQVGFERVERDERAMGAATIYVGYKGQPQESRSRCTGKTQA